MSSTVIIPTSYAALVEAMGSGNAQIGWLPPLVYMLAKYRRVMPMSVCVTLRRGSDTYGVQILRERRFWFHLLF